MSTGQSKDLILPFNKTWDNKLLSARNKGGNGNWFISKLLLILYILQNIETCEYLWLLILHAQQFAEDDWKWKNRKVHRAK